jgi:hypothetical protein
MERNCGESSLYGSPTELITEGIFTRKSINI